MKIHNKQRVLTFKENLVKAYGLIWDDYMTATMQNRIEQHPTMHLRSRTTLWNLYWQSVPVCMKLLEHSKASLLSFQH
jgi:hypothetical protein